MFFQPKPQNINQFGTGSAVDLKGIKICCRYIGVGCTRSTDEFLKVFTDSFNPLLFRQLCLVLVTAEGPPLPKSFGFSFRQVQTEHCRTKVYNPDKTKKKLEQIVEVKCPRASSDPFQ